MQVIGAKRVGIPVSRPTACPRRCRISNPVKLRALLKDDDSVIDVVKKNAGAVLGAMAAASLVSDFERVILSRNVVQSGNWYLSGGSCAIVTSISQILRHEDQCMRL